MTIKKSFEQRAREEVERIKAQKAAEVERKQARMRELSEQARKYREAEAAEQRKREAERNAKLRRVQEEEARSEERRARTLAIHRWKANGGTEAAFDKAWPSMWQKLLKGRTMDGESRAREGQRISGVSRI
jgi:DNA repair exonuclease SbcCD ATPase subunit